MQVIFDSFLKNRTDFCIKKGMPAHSFRFRLIVGNEFAVVSAFGIFAYLQLAALGGIAFVAIGIAKGIVAH